MLANPPLIYSSVFDPANFVVGSATTFASVKITDSNINATLFPVFTSAAGSVEVLDIGSAFAINPGTAAMSLGSTLRLDGAGGDQNVCLGESAGGALTSGTFNTYIGAFAGPTNNTSNNNTAIGSNCGRNRVLSCVAIGVNVGNGSGEAAVAVGYNTAVTGIDNRLSVAIGEGAGQTGIKVNCVAIGKNACSVNPGTVSVGIGNSAGVNSLGGNAVAIGAFAGRDQQVSHSICINASGIPTIAPDSGCYIRPIRGIAAGLGANNVYYDPATSELYYSTT